jgi:ABC-2 type transport system ATP-binding protein
VSAGCVIEVEGLTKSYPSGFWRRPVRVLSDLSFRVDRNQVVGFLGPNGAGKTTTLKIVNRLTFPDAGTIRLFGRDERDSPDLRRRIGFMPEQPYFYEYLTGREFLRLCGCLCGMSGTAVRERLGEVIDRVGLSRAGDTAIRKYSKGMMQRLGLAQALLHDPDLLVLDEPMSGLDLLGRMEVRNLIRELKTAGKTIFFSTHIISDVEALCDRVVMLHGGRKVAEGSIEDLAADGGTGYVELLFSPAPPAAWIETAVLPPGAGSVQGNAFLLRAGSHEEADAWIVRFRDAGSLLRSCVPVKKALEEIYMERTSGAGRERV